MLCKAKQRWIGILVLLAMMVSIVAPTASAANAQYHIAVMAPYFTGPVDKAPEGSATEHYVAAGTKVEDLTNWHGSAVYKFNATGEEAAEFEQFCDDLNQKSRAFDARMQDEYGTAYGTTVILTDAVERAVVNTLWEDRLATGKYGTKVQPGEIVEDKTLYIIGSIAAETINVDSSQDSLQAAVALDLKITAGTDLLAKQAIEQLFENSLKTIVAYKGDKVSVLNLWTSSVYKLAPTEAAIDGLFNAWKTAMENLAEEADDTSLDNTAAVRGILNSAWKEAIRSQGLQRVDSSADLEDGALYIVGEIAEESYPGGSYTPPTAEEQPYSSEYTYEVYRANNPDLVAAFGEDRAAYLNHWLIYGRAEGRVAR